MDLLDPNGRVIGNSHSGVLFAVLEYGGDYRLRVRMPAAERHAFTLDFRRHGETPPRTPAPIAIGSVVDDILDFDSDISEPAYGGRTSLSLSEMYSLPLHAGETVTVFMESNQLDPVLDAGVISALGYASAISNDDDGTSLTSRLVLRPARDETVVLRVRSAGNYGGEYRLTVRRGEVYSPEPATNQ